MHTSNERSGAGIQTPRSEKPRKNVPTKSCARDGFAFTRARSCWSKRALRERSVTTGRPGSPVAVRRLVLGHSWVVVVDITDDVLLSLHRRPLCPHTSSINNTNNTGRRAQTPRGVRAMRGSRDPGRRAKAKGSRRIGARDNLHRISFQRSGCRVVVVCLSRACQ